MFCKKKAYTQYRHTTDRGGFAVILRAGLAVLGRYHFCGVSLLVV
jgi:hypothetical protein